MTFMELWTRLEDRLGYHQAPVNPRATGLRDLFECSPLHPELMTRLARDIYARNSCRGLTDAVRRTETLDALGPIRREFLRAAGADVDVHRLLEDLCVIVSDAFAVGARDDAAPASGGAAVIPLDSARRRGRRLKGPT